MLPQIHSRGVRKWISWKFQKTIVHGCPIFSRGPLSFYINLCNPGECRKMNSVKNTSECKGRRHSTFVCYSFTLFFLHHWVRERRTGEGGFAPIEDSWSVAMGREPRQYKYIPVLKCGCTGATCCPSSLDQLTAAGAKSSSNILCPILHIVLLYFYIIPILLHIRFSFLEALVVHPEALLALHVVETIVNPLSAGAGGIGIARTQGVLQPKCDWFWFKSVSFTCVKGTV